MIVQRLTTIAPLVRFWPFFKEGIVYESNYLRYSHPIDVYRKMLFRLVRDHANAWIGVAFDDHESPIAFIFAHDCSPLFAEDREFEVSMFYYKSGNKPAIRSLQRRLDDFCRENGICRYYLTTSSFCSTAERVFNDSWKGLERSNTVFKRDLTK